MSDDYTGHLLEQVLDEIEAVHELVAEVPKMVHKLDHVEQKVDKLERDMQVVKVAVTATNRDVDVLDNRVSRLEAA